MPPDDPKGLPAWGRALVTLLNQVLAELDTRTSNVGVFHARRLGAPSGTTLTSANVALGAGWGAGATFTISGNDQRGSIIVTAAGVPAASATVTITFADGKWRTAPFATASRGDVNTPIGAMTASITTSVLTLTFNGIPIAASAYTLNWMVMG